MRGLKPECSYEGWILLDMMETRSETSAHLPLQELQIPVLCAVMVRGDDGNWCCIPDVLGRHWRKESPAHLLCLPLHRQDVHIRVGLRYGCKGVSLDNCCLSLNLNNPVLFVDQDVQDVTCIRECSLRPDAMKGGSRTRSYLQSGLPH